MYDLDRINTGRWIVADPTGRNLPDALQVGIITGAEWAPAGDDGGADGAGRWIYSVRFNGEDVSYSIAHIHTVLEVS